MLRYRWISREAAYPTLFALSWNGFLVFATPQVVRSANSNWWLLLVFVFIAAGLWLAFWALGLIFNTTTIRLDTRGMRVSIGPFAFRRSVEFPLEVIESVAVRSRAGHKPGHDVHSLTIHCTDGFPRDLISSARRDEIDTLHAALQPEFTARKDAMPPAIPNLAVSPSSRLRIEKQQDELRIHFRWRSPAVRTGLLFCLIWNGMLVAIASAFFQSRPPIPVILIMSVLCIAGLFLAYVTLAQLFNSTIIAIKYGTINVHHRPFWYSGDGQLPASEVKDVEVQQETSRSQEQTWQVVLKLKDGTERKLLQITPTRPQADSIARAMADFLRVDCRLAT